MDLDLKTHPLHNLYQMLVNTFISHSEELSDKNSIVNGYVNEVSGSYEINGNKYVFTYHLKNKDLFIEIKYSNDWIILKHYADIEFCIRLFNKEHFGKLQKITYMFFTDLYQMLKEKNMLDSKTPELIMVC